MLKMQLQVLLVRSADFFKLESEHIVAAEEGGLFRPLHPMTCVVLKSRSSNQQWKETVHKGKERNKGGGEWVANRNKLEN